MKNTKKTDSSMNIIIVGCGKIGENLAEQLNEQGYNISIVDVDAEKVNKISERCDCLGIVGNGATNAVLESAGINEADLLIAVTGSDELNILCCIVAKRSGHCQTIARVKNPEYSTEASYLKNELGLAMVINPQYAAAKEIERILRFPSAMKVDTFAGGFVELVTFRLPEKSNLVGMSVKDVVAELHCDVLICTIERGEDAFIANASSVFRGKDIISFVSSPKNAENFFKKIGFSTHSVKNTVIAGGGEIGEYLIKLLDNDGIRVKIIDSNPSVCNELAIRYPYAEIVHGNAGDSELMLQEGVKDADAFVALTNLDEENILISLFAKSIGCKKLVTKIKRADFSDVVKHLDLDSIVYPKAIIA